MADILINSISDFLNASDETATYILTTDLNFGNTPATFGQNGGLNLLGGFIFDGRGYTLSNIDNSGNDDGVFHMAYVENTNFSNLKIKTKVIKDFIGVYNLQFLLVEFNNNSSGEHGLFRMTTNTEYIRNILCESVIHYQTASTVYSSVLFGDYQMNANIQEEHQTNLIIENIEMNNCGINNDANYKGGIIAGLKLRNFNITIRNIRVSGGMSNDSSINQNRFGMVIGELEEGTAYTGKLLIENCLCYSNNIIQFYGASANIIGEIFKDNNVPFTSNTTIKDCVVYTDRFISNISATFPKNGPLFDKLYSINYESIPVLINNYGNANMRNTDNFNFNVAWRYSQIGSTYTDYNALVNDDTVFTNANFDLVNVWEKVNGQLPKIRIPDIPPIGGLQGGFVKVGGVWRNASNGYVKVNGVWREMIEAFINR